MTTTVIECPKCHGAHTGDKIPGVGGCNYCHGDGVVPSPSPRPPTAKQPHARGARPARMKG